MGVFDFKKRFGHPIEPQEARKDFVNKINHYLFQEIDEWGGKYVNGSNGRPLFNYICLGLNKEPRVVLSTYNSDVYYGEPSLPPIKYFSRSEYEQTLMVIEILYEYYEKTDVYQKEKWLGLIDRVVRYSLVQPISLGVSWREGKFYPEGAEEITERLINDVLRWLGDRAKVRNLFKNALDHYAKSLHDEIKRKDVIINAFQAVETLAKELLKNDKSFDNNYPTLVKDIDLDHRWGNILNQYKEMSKEYGRHSGRDKEYIPSLSNTEAFLNLSGLLLRLILITMQENAKE